MKFAASIKSLTLLLIAAALTACGGGGGSDGDSVFTPPGIRVTATAASASIGINSATDVSVRVTQASGAPLSDGTTVSAAVSPAGIGNIASLTGTQTATTSGGNANFRFQSGGQVGTAILTFAVQDPNAAGRTASATVNITITGATTGDSRLTIEPQRTSLPVNAFNVDPFVGSPYLTEITITARTASGQPINQVDGLSVSVNPVGSTGGFSTLDDPTTTDDLSTPQIENNEFINRLAQGPVDIVAGRATIFLHSLNTSGPTTLTVTMRDPETGQIVIATRTFNITSVTPPLPSDVIVSPQVGRPVYVQGSGGNTSTQIQVQVNDAIGQPVPDPVAGNTAFNNVRLELIGDNAGERLAGINAAGQNVTGRTISLRTNSGVANAIFTSGTRSGTILVRATSDRADNNVDNGLQDPVVGERTVVISDGRLFNIEITQPVENALTINPVDPGVAPTPGSVPNSPDGSYSITVAIIATDRLGNPVIPGTPIRFGLIDHPQSTGIGDFNIAGNDGNPQEGGTLFTAPSGQFTTAGGGAGPGDSLVIFGKNVPGNRDLESQRVVATINSRSSLTVQRRFNLNDDTGVSVDFGNLLPYIIGRAVSGTIVAEGLTNEFGIARTVMTYPVSRLGRRVVVWAQGEGDIVNGSAETVADVDVLAFAGVSPLTLIASPTSIPANTTSTVQVCALDAFETPLQGVIISYSFSGLSGNGSVDGNGISGVLDNPTGTNGCALASVTTSGVTSSSAQVIFSVGSVQAPVDIELGTLVLQARPSVITTASQLVTLTLLNANGQPQPGILITGTCSGNNGTIIALSNGPGVTNAQGQTTVQVTSTNLDQIGQAGGGSCDFQTADGSASTTVEVIGQDFCLLPVSPLPEGCDPPQTFNVSLTLVDPVGNVVPNGTTGFAVVSNPVGITCSVADGGTQTCTGQFEEGTGVTFTTLPIGSGPEISWTGSCAPADGVGVDDQGIILGLTGNASCTGTAQP